MGFIVTLVLVWVALFGTITLNSVSPIGRNIYDTRTYLLPPVIITGRLGNRRAPPASRELSVKRASRASYCVSLKLYYMIVACGPFTPSSSQQPWPWPPSC